MNLDRVKAVISGGASGLGQATAVRPAAGGAQVALLDVQDDSGRKVAAAIGAAASYHRCDVTSETEVEAAVQELIGLLPKPGAIESSTGEKTPKTGTLQRKPFFKVALP